MARGASAGARASRQEERERLARRRLPVLVRSEREFEASGDVRLPTWIRATSTGLLGRFADWPWGIGGPRPPGAPPTSTASSASWAASATSRSHPPAYPSTTSPRTGTPDQPTHDTAPPRTAPASRRPLLPMHPGTAAVMSRTAAHSSFPDEANAAEFRRRSLAPDDKQALHESRARFRLRVVAALATACSPRWQRQPTAECSLARDGAVRSRFRPFRTP
jgi:hypothetical protein